MFTASQSRKKQPEIRQNIEKFLKKEENSKDLLLETEETAIKCQLRFLNTEASCSPKDTNSESTPRSNPGFKQSRNVDLMINVRTGDFLESSPEIELQAKQKGGKATSSVRKAIPLHKTQFHVHPGTTKTEDKYQ